MKVEKMTVVLPVGQPVNSLEVGCSHYVTSAERFFQSFKGFFVSIFVTAEAVHDVDGVTYQALLEDGEFFSWRLSRTVY